MTWYTETGVYLWLKEEKPNLLAYAGWLADEFQKAFNKGKQVGRGSRDDEIYDLRGEIAFQREEIEGLLEACKDMLSDMRLMGMDGEGYHESMTAAVAAIAKAEGNQS